MATKKREVPNRRGNGKYPWEKWEDGKAHTVVRGADFEVEPQVMRGQVLRRAWAKGRAAETSVDGDKVTFKFKDREEKAPKAA